MAERLKKLLRPLYYNSIIRLEKWLIGIIPLKDYIFFEGVPDFQGNARFVYEEMIRRGWNEYYRMYWAVEAPEKFADYRVKNTFFIKKGSSEWKRISWRSKALIACNFTFYKAVPRKDQLNYYLSHGAALKSADGHCRIGAEISYVNILSDFFAEYQKKEFQCSENIFTFLGFPRNDVFFQKPAVNLHEVFAGRQFKKCILWLPTFRQNLKGTRIYSSISQPIIHNTNDAVQINEYARQLDCLIVLKPHFNQDISHIIKADLNNLLVLSDEDLGCSNLSLYQLLAASDALITDYSSVFWDYLNADKPIGLCWEDYNDFKEKNGFAVDTALVEKASELINNAEDMQTFLSHISSGEDVKQRERQELKELALGKTEELSSKRVVDFIERQLKK